MSDAIDFALLDGETIYATKQDALDAIHAFEKEYNPDWVIDWPSIDERGVISYFAGKYYELDHEHDEIYRIFSWHIFNEPFKHVICNYTHPHEFIRSLTKNKTSIFLKINKPKHLTLGVGVPDLENKTLYINYIRIRDMKMHFVFNPNSVFKSLLLTTEPDFMFKITQEELSDMAMAIACL